MAEGTGRAGGDGGAVADSADDAQVEALLHHRGCIDRIDKTIVALLTERVRLGIELGNLKRTLRLPLRCDTRETEVLARVGDAAARPLSPRSAVRIFSAIIAETSAAQENHD